MLKCIFYFILFIATSIPLCSTEPMNIKTFFTDNEIKRVKRGEIITRMYLKNNATNENTDLKIQIPKTSYVNEDFSVYEMITDEKAFFPYKITDGATKLKFYNILAAYSKLSGMKYFSRRIFKIKELIIKSFKIESPKKKILLTTLFIKK